MTKAVTWPAIWPPKLVLSDPQVLGTLPVEEVRCGLAESVKHGLLAGGDLHDIIMHGEKDPGVPLSQSQQLHEKILTAGAQSELKVITNAGHGGKEFQAPEAKQLVLDFFSRTLKD